MRPVLVMVTLLLAGVSAMVTSNSYLYGTAEERSMAVQQAIDEAKTHSQTAREKARIASENSKRIQVGKHFKFLSKEARRQGEARLMYEDMVHRAERKLAEMERKSHGDTENAKDKAEMLAMELFHTPGTRLTGEELARMKTESGCTPREKPTCYTPTFQIFRKINGECNNLDFPFLGAADTDFARLIPSQYEDGISKLRGNTQARESDLLVDPFKPPNPSARHVSSSVIRNVTEDEAISHLLMQWGQFLDHDLTLGPELEDECPHRFCEFTEICQPIRVADRDPVFGVGTENNANCLPFSRSATICDLGGEEPAISSHEEEPPTTPFPPREQVNVLTSFVDASMVYGSDDEFAFRIRAFVGGLLLEGESLPNMLADLPEVTQMENQRSLEEGTFVGCPPELTKCFLAGEFRVNEQVVLTVMHTLWFREHNRIARELSRLNSHWNDDRIYQEARRIVGALVQKISYDEFLPKILGPTLFSLVVGEYTGYREDVNPSVNNAFATAAFRFGHTLIRPFFDRLGVNFQPLSIGPLNLRDAFFAPEQYDNSFGTDPIIRGLLTANARRVDEFLAEVLTNELFREQMDLASLNMQRGRDHGLPPYLTWVRHCQTIFPTLYPNPQPSFSNGLTQVELISIYGSLDTVDLWIGGLAEERLPGSILGPTFACLFGITFANARDGDRFFYLNPGQFKQAQVDSINSDSLSRVICDNTDNIDNIQLDAFDPAASRVSCSNVPSLDLSLWQEIPCYISVSVNQADTVSLRSYSRNDPRVFFKFVPADIRPRRGCVPFICPGLSETDVIVFPEPLKRTRVTVLPNPLLQPSSITPEDKFRGTITSSLVDSPQTGLFRELSDCERPGPIGLTINLTPTFSSNRPVLGFPQQANTVTSESPSTEERLPDDILEILLEPLPPAPAAAAAAAAEIIPQDNEMDDEAKLMSELEEALNALNA